jgi:hypothetical protein
MILIVYHHNTPIRHVYIYLINTVYKMDNYRFQYCTKIKILTYCNAHPYVMLFTSLSTNPKISKTKTRAS